MNWTWTGARRSSWSAAISSVGGPVCGRHDLASLTPAGLALKLPQPSREAMFGDGRGSALRYFDGGRVKREYVVLSQTVAANHTEVCELFSASFHYVRG